MSDINMEDKTKYAGQGFDPTLELRGSFVCTTKSVLFAVSWAGYHLPMSRHIKDQIIVLYCRMCFVRTARDIKPGVKTVGEGFTKKQVLCPYFPLSPF